MRCGELVGRADELALLGRSLADTRQGRGGVVALVGEAGAGKSRLLGELAAAAGGAGLPVLSGRSVPGPSPVPFRPLTEAFLAAFRSSPPPIDDSLAGFTGHLARLVPAWGVGRGADGDVDGSPVLLAEAVARLLAVVGARAGGAVLILEDVHWADPETVAVLDYLADALAATPVLCACTARPAGPAPELFDRLERRRPGTVVPVRPLGGEEVERMVAACLSSPDPPAVVTDFVRTRSEGNPFLVEELLAGLVSTAELRFEGGRWSSDDTLTPSVPAGLRESIRHRLAVLDGSTGRVLGAAAMLGRTFDWELLPGIAGVDGRAAVDGLRAAVAEQLIEVEGTGFTFRHALTREAVLADLLPPERRDLAARAWSAVERANPGLPGPTCELAADLAEAAGDREAAAERLVESARRALAAGALATAEATVRRARHLAAADPQASLSAEELLVHVLVAAGKTAEALGLGRDLAVRLVAAGAPSARRVDLLVTTARAAVTAGDLASAATDVAAARLAGAEEPDPALAARIDAVAAHVALDSDDGVDAARLATLAREGAAATGQPAVECDALIVLGRVERASDIAGTESFEAAARIAEEAGLGTWHLRAQQELALAPTGDEDGALRETRAVAARYGALVTVAVMDLSLADVALSNFDREGCLEAATACAEASRRYGLATEPVAFLWLAGAHALAGDDAAMQSAIDASLAVDPDDPRILGDLYGRVLATRAFVADDLPALPGLLDTMVGYVRRAPQGTSVYPGRVLWALVHAVDDDDLGAPARSELDEAVRRYRMAYFDLCREVVEAVVLGRRGEGDAAGERFGRAYEQLTTLPLSRGTTHASSLLVARAALRDGWGDPLRWLRTAEAFFAAGGHERLARRCRTMLGEAGAPVPRRRGTSEVPTSLRGLGVTSREVDVLKLVGAGCSTKEIAAQLFLSTKTVERHLSSLFDRTGVRNRRALAEVAAAHLGEADR